MPKSTSKSSNGKRPSAAQPSGHAEKWKPDTLMKFDYIEGRKIYSHPIDFLAVEGNDKMVRIYIPHHGNVAEVSLRLNFEDFIARMPSGILREIVRGVAICEKRLTELLPEDGKLEFDGAYRITLKHHVSPRKFKTIGK